MKIQDATRDYESWLGGKTPFDHSDIQYKHARMSDPGDPFPFFRGTYYRWAQHWPEVCADLVEAPRVLGIGDLHVENFGTWRDGEGRLCWGINDYDEADEVPCVHDLVRLAASVFLLKRLGILETKFKPACVAILEGYRASLAAGGEPFVLEERHPELRALAMSSDRDPAAFWNKLTGLLQNPAVEPPPAARAALLGDLPAEHVKPEFRLRPRVGMGSLGKPRFLLLAEWAGGRIAREAKAVTPPSTAWAAGRDAPPRMAEIVARAKHAGDPFYRPGEEWVARRLGPRCSRIELGHLGGVGDLTVLLKAMGAETANVHLGSADAADILRYLEERQEGWLPAAAKAMAAAIRVDWIDWCSGAVPLPSRR